METYGLYNFCLHKTRKLRKNHSGMETAILLSVIADGKQRCVRTIVVWKLATTIPMAAPMASCVRTIVVWKLLLGLFYLSLIITLRKNHSGMETLILFSIAISSPLLRKNHSGMETGVGGG